MRVLLLLVLSLFHQLTNACTETCGPYRRFLKKYWLCDPETGREVCSPQTRSYLRRGWECGKCEAPRECPPPGAKKVLNGYREGSELKVKISGENLLCGLYLASRRGMVLPVGRSYNGHSWEAYAGKYAKQTFNCSNGVCTTKLPKTSRLLQLRYGRYKYNLVGFSNDLSSPDARMLEQTTFGPTMEDINAMSGTTPADYIKDQMILPATSHRQFFRKRLNHRFGEPSIMGVVTKPCDVGTRYRRYAFSDKDYLKYVELQKIGTYIFLSIDGQNRTAIQANSLRYEKDGENKGPFLVENRGYQLCQRQANGINGRLRLRNSPTSSCLDIYKDDEEEHMGIPAIDFPVESEPANVVDLTGHVEQIQGGLYDTAISQELYVTSAPDDALCEDAVPDVQGMPPFQVFGKYMDQYWLHDPRFVIRDNTAESPQINGGGDLYSATEDVDFYLSRTQCANVPKSFLNEEHCVLSDAPDVCRTDLNSVETIDLTIENFRLAYEKSWRNKYIYAVEGLRTNTNEVPAPCTHGETSRWLRVEGDEASCLSGGTAVNSDTRTAIANLIGASESTNPHVVDVRMPLMGNCHVDDVGEKDFQVFHNDQCYLNVHPDHLSVFDFTPWANLWEHPGSRNGGMKAFAVDDNFILQYREDHPMNRWYGRLDSTGELSSSYRVRLGTLDDTINLSEAPNVRGAFSVLLRESTVSGPTVVCGSINEVANDPALHGSSLEGGFDAKTKLNRTSGFWEMEDQRVTIWSEIALKAKDQLRQRVAWILSQLLVISPGSLSRIDETEGFINYYDIFVRHAFGNYRSILKEVAYSPMMGAMLTYMDGQSTSFVLQASRYSRVEFPDENFAREIMQLFTIGLVELEQDGTVKLDESKQVIGTYNNDDITEYARLWTGFYRSDNRGNMEDGEAQWGNYVDPMKQNVNTHDPYPKMGLNGHYIADGYPLCRDLPMSKSYKHFLLKGATYHLLGSTPKTRYLSEPIDWINTPTVERLELTPTSNLFQKICNANESGTCQYKSVVSLDETVQCKGSECNIQTPRVVEVEPGIFYEYTPPACATLAFATNAKLMKRRYGIYSCGDPSEAVGAIACCEAGRNSATTSPSIFNAERVNLQLAVNRCKAAGLGLCERPYYNCAVNNDCDSTVSHWTAQACLLQAKIDPTGRVGIVHSSNDGNVTRFEHNVNETTKTFFRVAWTQSSDVALDNFLNDYEAKCINMGCRLDYYDSMCLCTATSRDERAFFDAPTRDEVLVELHYGAFDFEYSGMGYQVQILGGGVKMYSKDGKFTKDSVFEVNDDYGVKRFRKNVRSIVSVGTNLKFRNPTHFGSLTYPDLKDFAAEIDAGLDHYFYHPNTAPFLATRFIQRFGISNPSPRFVGEVSEAFRRGSYSGGGQKFGSGEYGDLGAMVAAILLDREARSIVLDADPFHGSLQEPLLKVIRVMRSLRFEGHGDFPMLRYGTDLQDRIGQQAHSMPSVFSFFLPEYSPAGALNDAALTCPECQILTGPKAVSLLNGLGSLIKYGFDSAYDGFGFGREWGEYKRNIGDSSYGYGNLTYVPAESTPQKIVDELALLLTSDRLSMSKRTQLVQVFDEQETKDIAILTVIQLILSCAEFQTNALADNQANKIAPIEDPVVESTSPYKAVVYIMLSGGADSYNMLAPHSCQASGGKENLRTQYEKERGVLKFSDSERKLLIDATNQPCTKFALHQKMTSFEREYKDNNLLFFANVGAIENAEMTKDNYEARNSNLRLFGHNTMQSEIQGMDPVPFNPGTGILGRLLTTLRTKGFSADSISIDNPALAVEEEPNAARQEPTIVSRYGLSSFDRKPYKETYDLQGKVFQLNGKPRRFSSAVGKAWTAQVINGIKDSNKLKELLDNATLSEDIWPGSLDWETRVFSTVSRMIQTRSKRGVDRDVYFLDISSWDHHANLKENLEREVQELNGNVDLLVKELKAQGLYDDVTIVIGSEFARTITGNGGQGSDHAWGGHYMMMGGAVKGGRVLGQYPDDITPEGPLNIGRGRIIPTTSWDAIWNGVAQWMGVETESELDYCLPNRIKSTTGAGVTGLMQASDLFKSTSRRNLRRANKQE